MLKESERVPKRCTHFSPSGGLTRRVCIHTGPPTSVYGYSLRDVAERKARTLRASDGLDDDRTKSNATCKWVVRPLGGEVQQNRGLVLKAHADQFRRAFYGRAVRQLPVLAEGANGLKQTTCRRIFDNLVNSSVPSVFACCKYASKGVISKTI